MIELVAAASAEKNALTAEVAVDPGVMPVAVGHDVKVVDLGAMPAGRDVIRAAVGHAVENRVIVTIRDREEIEMIINILAKSRAEMDSIHNNQSKMVADLRNARI